MMTLPKLDKEYRKSFPRLKLEKILKNNEDKKLRVEERSGEHDRNINGDRRNSEMTLSRWYLHQGCQVLKNTLRKMGNKIKQN